MKKSLKNILNCCKLHIVFKNNTRLGNNFHFKDRIPKDLTSVVVYKFQCGQCNESYYGEYVRHLDVRIGQHIGVPSLTKKQVKPRNSSVADHLLFCNHSVNGTVQFTFFLVMRLNITTVTSCDSLIIIHVT